MDVDSPPPPPLDLDNDSPQLATDIFQTGVKDSLLFNQEVNKTKRPTKESIAMMKKNDTTVYSSKSPTLKPF